MRAMNAPAGWYPDPQPPAPGSPSQQRYWDGQVWTTHVAVAEQQPTYSGGPMYGVPATTPDGAPLAGWWQRVGASLIDFLILVPVVSVLALPFIRDIISAFGDYFETAMTAAENGNPAPPAAQFQRDVAREFLAFAAIGFVVGLAYTVGFLMWKQATPGKLALGLRVRLRDRPELPLSAVLLRWATQSAAPGVVGLVPFIGVIGSVFSLLDGLWPLWDDKKQAIHDKVAKTNVVRVR
jgi:uncharacterized RDD family membrane protein YckC